MQIRPDSLDINGTRGSRFMGIILCQSKTLGYGEEGLYVDIISLEVLTLLDALEIMVLWESK